MLRYIIEWILILSLGVIIGGGLEYYEFEYSPFRLLAKLYFYVGY